MSSFVAFDHAGRRCIGRLRLASLRARARGAALIVDGAPGVGKTTMVAHALSSSSATVIDVSCNVDTDLGALMGWIAFAKRAGRPEETARIIVDDIDRLDVAERAHLWKIAACAAPGNLWVLVGVAPELRFANPESSIEVTPFDGHPHVARAQRASDYARSLEAGPRALLHLLSSTDDVPFQVIRDVLAFTSDELHHAIAVLEAASLARARRLRGMAVCGSYCTMSRETIRASLDPQVLNAYAKAVARARLRRPMPG